MNKKFIKDRNEAFQSGDKDKIIAYCKKYNVIVPEDETIFWMGVHKAICHLYLASADNGITMEQYQESYKWLAAHGSTPSIS